MILTQISLLDCLVFVLFLAPQLLIQVGVLTALKTILETLPFFLFTLPYQTIKTSLFTPPQARPPYHATAPSFASLVIRCVRHAFANIPASVGAVFFSKPVALPFAQWRLLRHGILPLPETFFEGPKFFIPRVFVESNIRVGLLGRLYERLVGDRAPYLVRVGVSYLRSAFFAALRWVGFKAPDLYFGKVCIDRSESGHEPLKGVFIAADPTREPDVVVYYLHGGGFAMGSPWFYLEFLLAWVTLLRDGIHPNDKTRTQQKHFRNPALFALDYTLVPTATFPTQLQQTLKGYEFVNSLLPSHEKTQSDQARDGSPPIILSGDSAGATMALSLLLVLAKGRTDVPRSTSLLPPPRLATLISPWCRLISELNRDTPSDYLNADSLHLYACEYLNKQKPNDEDNRADKARLQNGVNGYASVDKTLDVYDEFITKDVASPGDVKGSGSDENVKPGSENVSWSSASPSQGYQFIFGAEEVLAPETRRLVTVLKRTALRGQDRSVVEGDEKGKGAGKELVKVTEKVAGIHAWPVVSLFLGQKDDDRLEGLRQVADIVVERCLTP